MTKMKSTEEYLREPYSRAVIPDSESGTFTGQILEFPGCIAQGDTPQEAYANLEEAAKGWLQAALDTGQSIPEPFANQDFGGKVSLRLTKSLHRQATLYAEHEGVSLNQFILAAVAEKVGEVKAMRQTPYPSYVGLQQYFAQSHLLIERGVMGVMNISLGDKFASTDISRKQDFDLTKDLKSLVVKEYVSSKGGHRYG